METKMTGTCARRLRWVLGALAVVAVVGFSAARAQATVESVIGCGAYLTGDETYVLVSDVLDCGEGTPAIRVVGPAKLKLNGHTVSCAPAVEESENPTIGILLEGKGASLIGGTRPPFGVHGVTGCEQGVVLNGEGDHSVQGVTVTRSSSGAFVIESDGNTLVGNIVRQALPWANSDPIEGSGFLVSGDQNELLGNVASDNDSDDEGGFTIEGNENHLKDNISKDNAGYGYLVQGRGNLLSDNTALKNEDHGFVVAEEAHGNVLKGNKSLENGDEPAADLAASGFVVEGSGNHLEGNLSIRNGIYGIHLTESAEGNIVSRNTAADNFGVLIGLDALGNPIGTGLDLVDESDCSTTWYKNIFGTRSARCIK